MKKIVFVILTTLLILNLNAQDVLVANFFVSDGAAYFQIQNKIGCLIPGTIFLSDNATKNVLGFSGFIKPECFATFGMNCNWSWQKGEKLIFQSTFGDFVWAVPINYDLQNGDKDYGIIQSESKDNFLDEIEKMIAEVEKALFDLGKKSPSNKKIPHQYRGKYLGDDLFKLNEAIETAFDDIRLDTSFENSKYEFVPKKSQVEYWAIQKEQVQTKLEHAEASLKRAKESQTKSFKIGYGTNSSSLIVQLAQNLVNLYKKQITGYSIKENACRDVSNNY